MTAETKDRTSVDPALECVDGFLSEISHLTLIDAPRVVDFCLDLRLHLNNVDCS